MNEVSMSRRRVVVTGLGMLSPLGNGVSHNWSAITQSKSGLGPITLFDASDIPAKVAGEVPKGEGEGMFNADSVMSPKEQRKVDTFIIYGVAAAEEAIQDAGWTPTDDYELDRTGVMIGSGIGGLPSIEAGSIKIHEEGSRKLSPFFIPASLINLASGHVSIRHGYRGPNHSVVTACATGTHAIGDAAELIRKDEADVMIAGGAEAAICRIGVAGFAAARALSTSFNETPEKASRPWDKDRDGFVMGEGAGVVVLEEYEHAKKRGAKIYGELVGYGLTGDGYHVTAPHPEGRGGYRAMEAAFRNAGMSPEDIDYINAHGTSTPLGDEIEYNAVKRLFGDHAKSVSMSSTKSAIGHLLGAAGAVEAIYTLLALKHQTAPPTINLDNPFDGCDMDLVPHHAKERPIRAAMSNSFGFGGTNASLIFKAC